MEGSSDNGSQDSGHFPGTVESFNNYKDGKQNFGDVTIESSKTMYSFDNVRSGEQTMKGAEIRCVDYSGKRRWISKEHNNDSDHSAATTESPNPKEHSLIFNFTALEKIWKQNPDAHSGILLSFINEGELQNLDGIKVNVGHMSDDDHLAITAEPPNPRDRRISLISQIFTRFETVFDWKNWKQNHGAHSGIVLSFNNKGTQKLNINLNVGHKSGPKSTSGGRSSKP
ncbi:hypothetical protein E2542_SST16728 [Spatholobus suberectus]|nr:hypothetical protein E2542_SST16728 [Spatholobus suberectus]